MTFAGDKQFLGCGWQFPPGFEKSGDNASVLMVSAETDIRQSLMVLFRTVPGERVPATIPAGPGPAAGANARAHSSGIFTRTEADCRHRCRASPSRLGPRQQGGHHEHPTQAAPRAGSTPLNLNLYIMVSASFNNYALKMLSCTLDFFQGRPGFDAQSMTGLPPHLDKFTVELVSICPQEMHDLWGILGAKYLPPTVYKLRMLTLQQGWMEEQLPEVQHPDVSVGGKP